MEGLLSTGPTPTSLCLYSKPVNCATKMAVLDWVAQLAARQVAATIRMQYARSKWPRDNDTVTNVLSII